MNKAIAYATLIRFSRPTFLVMLAFFIFAIPMFLSRQSTVTPVVAEMMESFLLTGPLLPSITSYFLIRDQLANSKSLNDGEYLTLLFTRPLSRADYVISKWLLCGTLVALIVLSQLLVYHCCQLATGRIDHVFTGPNAVLDVFLNSFGITAAILVINSLPPRVGAFMFVSVLYFSMILSTLPHVEFGAQTTFGAALGLIGGFLHGCANPTIQTADLFNSTKFSYLPLITYFSNVSLYLIMATLILSKREFFYASN